MGRAALCADPLARNDGVLFAKHTSAFARRDAPERCPNLLPVQPRSGNLDREDLALLSRYDIYRSYIDNRPLKPMGAGVSNIGKQAPVARRKS